MRRIIALVFIAALSLTTFQVQAEEVKSSAADILKSSYSTVAGVSLTGEIRGSSTSNFGPGLFVEWTGVGNQYLLVGDDLYSDGSGTLSYNVYLPSGVKPASLVAFLPEQSVSLIKLFEPNNDAKPIQPSGSPSISIGDELYVVYCLPRALSFKTGVLKTRIINAAKFGDTTLYGTDLDISSPSLTGVMNGIAYNSAGNPIGVMSKIPAEVADLAYVFPLSVLTETLSNLKGRANAKKIEIMPSDNPGWFGAITTANNLVLYNNLAAMNKPKIDGKSFYYGAFVSGLLDVSPASKAGFKPMDLIVEINDIRIQDDYANIEALFASYVVGASVKVVYLRYNTQVKKWMQKDLTMTIEKRPPASDVAAVYDDEFFKIQAKEFTWDLRLKTFILDRYSGVYLSKIEDDSLFNIFGIPADTVVIRVNGVDTPDLASFQNQLTAMHGKSGEKMEVLVCTPDGYNMPVYKRIKLP